VASDAVSKANQATAKVRLSLLSEAEQPRIAPSATLAPTQTVTSSSPLPAAPGAVTQNRENNPMHSSLSGRRVALVIGNGAYVHVKALPNPSNDARSIAKSLRDIGFSVTEGIDLDRGGMQTMIRDFLREAARAQVAMVYFAGAGGAADADAGARRSRRSNKEQAGAMVEFIPARRGFSGSEAVKVVFQLRHAGWR
jgi:hypothetical protein